MRIRPEVAAAAGAAAVWFGPAPAPLARPIARALRIPCTLADGHGVALTFDDGPDLHGTPAVLDVLAHAKVRATFFLVGEQVVRDPSLAREIVAAGHEVGAHGHRHVLLLRRSLRAVRDDLARAEDAIAAATGRPPALYRPPYGVFSGPALREVRRRGWKVLLWSRWGRDWEAAATPASIARLATNGLTGGDVVLLHDSARYSSAGSWRRTAAALPFVLDAALATGEPLVTASQST